MAGTEPWALSGCRPSPGPANGQRRGGRTSRRTCSLISFLPEHREEKQFVCSYTLKMSFPCSINHYYPRVSQFTFELGGYFLPKWLIMGDRWL